MNGKRPHEDDISSKKISKMKLESSSESDTESLHSSAEYNNELDTPASFTELNDAEFEVFDEERVKLTYYLSDDSLEDEELDDKVLEVPLDDAVDDGLLGDTSEENSTSPTSNSDVDPGLPRNDYLDFEKCSLCKTVEKDISYPYCSRCYLWKKNLFIERPKRKKGDFKKSQLQSNSLNINDNTSNLQNSENKNNCGEASHGSLNNNGVGSAHSVQRENIVDTLSQPSTSSPILTSSSASNIKNSGTCSVCFTKPENGLFVHSKTAHLYGCYTCAKKIWHQNGSCPLCRKKVNKVLKLF